MKKVLTVLLMFVILFNGCASAIKAEMPDKVYVRAKFITECRVEFQQYGTRFFQIISEQSLRYAAKKFIGKNVLDGHNREFENARGYVLDSDIRYDEEGKEYYIEGVFVVTDEKCIPMLLDGRLRFMSMGPARVKYNTTKEDGVDVRNVYQFDIHEVSIVVTPRDEEAKILEVSRDMLKLSPKKEK